MDPSHADGVGTAIVHPLGVNSRSKMPNLAIVTAVTLYGKDWLDIYQYLPIVTTTIARLLFGCVDIAGYWGTAYKTTPAAHSVRLFLALGIVAML